MAIDYKDISFSFQKKRRKKIFQRIRLVLLGGIILLTAGMIFRNIQAGKLHRVQALILESKIEDAASLLARSSGSIFLKEARRECRALIYMLQNDLEAAEPILRKNKFRSHVIKRKQFLDFFSNNGEYRKLKFYSQQLKAKGKHVGIYEIISQTALYSPDSAGTLMEQLGESERQEHAKELSILKAVNSQVKDNEVECIFDINGKTIASYDPKKKRMIPRIPGFSFTPFAPALAEGIRYFKCSLDGDIQRKIHRLFSKNHGSFILTRLQDGSIAAAYSKPFDPHPGNAAFTRKYQPGSIIKILTLFGYLNITGNREFSTFCRGSKSLSGKVFYDWQAHNAIGSFHQALAVSCNISFAEMADKIGEAKLKEVLAGFLFNRKAMTDGPLQFNLGTFRKRDLNDYETARLSVGLDEISITTIHAAILASFFSQNGTIYAPHLIQNRKNILQLGYSNHRPQFLQAPKNNQVFSDIQKAMLQVTEEGTGQLARVDFTSLAIKTGTTGGRPGGFHAILIGYFPATKPEYAFAFRLERGGKASPHGARFLKRFILAFYSRDKQSSST